MKLINKTIETIDYNYYIINYPTTFIIVIILLVLLVVFFIMTRPMNWLGDNY